MDATTTCAIYDSAFHGGGREGAHYSAPGYLISRHRNEQAAIRKYKSLAKSNGDCRCGSPILIVEITGDGRAQYHQPVWPDAPLPEIIERRGYVHDDRIALR